MPHTHATQTLISAIFAAGAVFAQPAVAADCSGIKAIAAAQPDGFESIKGDIRTSGLMSYSYFPTVSPVLAGFSSKDCSIKSSGHTVELRCSHKYDDENALVAAFDAAGAEFDRCLIRKDSSVTSAVQRSISYANPGAGNRDFYLGTKRAAGGSLELYFTLTKVK